MPAQQDYENDTKRSLQITDPYGNESNINNPKLYRECGICGLDCKHKNSGECSGNTHMLSDTKEHLCDKHSGRHGAPNNWYNSVPTEKDGPVQRELGMQGDNVKKSGNFAFDYKDEEDIGENYEKDDPRTTNG